MFVVRFGVKSVWTLKRRTTSVICRLIVENRKLLIFSIFFDFETRQDECLSELERDKRFIESTSVSLNGSVTNALTNHLVKNVKLGPVYF